MPHIPLVQYSGQQPAEQSEETQVVGRTSAKDGRNDAHFENASDLAELKAGLSLTPKHIPCGYLYNDKGSQLYEEITKLEEYYPFETEKELLAKHATEIVSSIPTGSIVVELGCGNAEKTSVLLHALIARYSRCRKHLSHFLVARTSYTERFAFAT